MIIGAHSIIHSKNAEADRAFLKDILKLSYVDAGHGWLIFGLPPSEIAFHPAESNNSHEFYFICKDVNAFIAAMAERGVACSPAQTQRWGILTQVTLPGGGTLGVYEPLHPRPISSSAPTLKKTAKKKSKSRKKIAMKKSRPMKKRRAK
jgi:hypothetical protein